MLEIVRRHVQDAANDSGIGFRHPLQAFAFHEENGGINDGLGCKTMEIAIFEAEDIARQVKCADLAATVR
jgi:hypothetical protein